MHICYVVFINLILSFCKLSQLTTIVVTDTNCRFVIVRVIITSMVYYYFKHWYQALWIIKQSSTDLYCQKSLVCWCWFVHVKAVSEDEEDNCLQKGFESWTFYSPLSPDQAQEPQEQVIKTHLTFLLSPHHSKCVWVCVKACFSDSRQPSLYLQSLTLMWISTPNC